MNTRLRLRRKLFPRLIAENMPDEWADDLHRIFQPGYKYKTPEWMTDFSPKRFCFSPLAMRDQYIKKGMFAYVTWDWIRPLAAWIGKRRVLEVMAGRGWVTLALRRLSVNIVATDDFSWILEGKGRFSWEGTVTDVENLDARAAVKHYGRNVDVVVMSWPPYAERVAYDVLKALHEVNPDAILLYIGEGAGGCTADDKFHAHYDDEMTFEDGRFKQVREGFKAWYAIHDMPFIGRYKENVERDEFDEEEDDDGE